MGAAHKFYVSNTQIDFRPDEHTLQITIKLFADDVDETVEANTAYALGLSTDTQHPEAAKHVQKYLAPLFMLQVNGKPVDCNWVGMEIEDDLLWCYLEVSNVRTVKSVEVQNELLMGYFPDQSNIVDVNAHGTTKSLLLRAGSSKQTVDFR